MESLEPRLLLDAATVDLGPDDNAWVRYEDGDGSQVVLRLDPQATGQAEIEADGAIQVDQVGLGARVTGVNLRMNVLDVTTPDGDTNVSFSVAGGDRMATLGELNAVGADLGLVRARKISLQNGAGLQAENIRLLQLGQASNTALVVAGDLQRAQVGPLDTVNFTAAEGSYWRFEETIVDSNLAVDRIGTLIFDGVVDPTTVQVTIEARFLQINSDVMDLGLDIADLGFGIFRGEVASSDLDFGQARRLQFQEPVTGSTIDATAIGSAVFKDLAGTDVTFPEVRQFRSDAIAGGIIDLDDVLGTLQLRQLSGGADVQILSAPRVTVRDARQADIFVLSTQSFTMRDGANDVGVELGVVPRISASGDFVLFDLQVTRTRSVNFLGSLQTSTFLVTQAVERSANFTGEVSDSVIDILETHRASFRKNVIRTDVLINEAQTLTLGGLIVEDSTFDVPVLGRLPVLGRVFRNNTINTEETLSIFIRPTMVNSKIDPVLLGNVRLLGGMVNSTLIADEIRNLTILGDVGGSTIFSGVDIGADGLFNTGDDTWSAGRIGRFSLLGTLMAGSLVGVGVDPGVDGLFFTGDDVGIGGAIERTNLRDYQVVNTGLPENQFGLIAAEGIAPFFANGQRIAPSVGNAYSHGDFNAVVTGVDVRVT
jgi:hypothetical protein